MRTKTYRRKMHRKKNNELIRMLNYTPYNPHAGYLKWGFVNGVWQSIGNHVQYPKNSNRQRFLKRLSNRRIRQGAILGTGKAGYKRCFDYWWELD